MEPVRFKNHLNETLSGTLHRPESAGDVGFVLGHCFTCSRHTRILIDLGNTLAGLGVCVLRFDFSGNGQSEGRFEESTYSKQIREMRLAVDYMKQNEADRVIIGGHSMGGMVSLFTAARGNDIAGVIALAAGATTLHPDRLLTDEQKKALFDNRCVAFASRGRDLFLTQDFFDDAAGYDVGKIIGNITCPVLLVLAANDEITNPGPVKALFNGVYPHIDLLEIEGADHMFTHEKHRHAVMEYVTRWIGKSF